MSVVSADRQGSATPTRTRTISPLAVVMVLLAIYGAYQYYAGNKVLFVALPWSIILGSAVVWAVYGAVAITILVRLQRYGRRPAWTVALALSWGGFVVLWLASVANSTLDTLLQKLTGSDAGVWSSGPVAEEVLKAIGVIALVLVPVLRRFRPVDGLFYGVLVGAGFQVVENYTYALNVAFSADPDARWQAIWVNVLLRGVFGLFSHAVWTGIVGAAIGWVAGGGGRRSVRVLTAVGALALAIVLHGTSNYLAQQDLTVPNVAVDVLGFIILVVLLLVIQRQEKGRLTDLALANAGWGLLDPSELSTTERGRSARRRRRLELRYAYAVDQFGLDDPLTQRAAARLA